MDNTEKLPSVLSFCSGYGGIERGLDIAGLEHRVVAYVEIEAYAVANLINKMEDNIIPPAPVYTDLKTFPSEVFRDRVDIITGGYPCQPFSAAGARKGTDDPRHLWPHIRRHIQSIRPFRVFFENVSGHITLGLNTVISDLEEDGFRSTWGIFSAAEVGAPHQRQRVWILGDSQHNGSSICEKPRDIVETVANSQEGKDPALKSQGASRSDSGEDLSGRVADSDSVRCDGRELSHGIGEREMEIEALERPRQSVVRSKAEGCGGDSGEVVADSDNTGQYSDCGSVQKSEVRHDTGRSSKALADTIGEGCERPERVRIDSSQTPEWGSRSYGSTAKCSNDRQQWEWPPEPRLGRVVDGCANRVDRIRLLGNGVVPQTAAKAWLTLNNRFKNER